MHRVPVQVGPEPDPDRPWLLDPNGWSGLGASVVFGVAEGWGRVLIGTEGWRSRYGRALALYVPEGSELWSSDRLRLLSERYGIPITGTLESLQAEWAPEPIEAPPSKRLNVASGLAMLRSGRGDDGDVATKPDPWPGAVMAMHANRTTRAGAPAPEVSAPDGTTRTTRHVAAVERLAGPGSKRILEIGPRAGYRTSPLGEHGHSVVAVAGDFARVELPGPFEVVYVGGFGEGSEDDQRRLLRRVGSWLEPGGCAIIEVVTP